MIHEVSQEESRMVGGRSSCAARIDLARLQGPDQNVAHEQPGISGRAGA